ncbi:hypothetical protein ACKVWC_005355 [Pyricularia oryzae]|uniref:Uncharacterized protein n=3 Tax=Pyricularia oryzae TaxID=318829 RepID=A0A4P7N4D5_PYROR|nr:hypothetical protein OOU_Y34scaffold00493g22 [Pyricularia oryzae Y34]KAI7927011.1 hypothetical protein M9X92_002499 [Pyricularia oryzae]KAI7932266.1 hypothetical protein M0657_000705 [Pyricularia oryzae]QBZ57357.1 hypothetical protein PoMZ_02281 [Pyricularia oryzae]
MSYHSSKYGVPVIISSKDERRSSVSSTDSRSSSSSRYSSSSVYSYSSAGASSRTSYSDSSYRDATSKQRSGRSEVVVVNTSRRSNPSRSSPTPDYGHVSERYTYPAHSSSSSRGSSGGSSSSRSSHTYYEPRR